MTLLRGMTRVLSALLSVAMVIASAPASACDLLCCLPHFRSDCHVEKSIVKAQRGPSGSSDLEMSSHHCEGVIGDVHRGAITVNPSPISTSDWLRTVASCPQDACRETSFAAVPTNTIQFSPVELAPAAPTDVPLLSALSHEEPHSARIDSGPVSQILALRI